MFGARLIEYELVYVHFIHSKLSAKNTEGDRLLLGCLICLAVGVLVKRNLELLACSEPLPIDDLSLTYVLVWTTLYAGIMM